MRARTSICLVALLVAAPLEAHVTLGEPNGGEVLTVGDAVMVEWVVAIQHNTENWDLWYSTTGAGGPWTAIATDLPAGDTNPGAMHAFTWTVPDTPSTQVRVRVRQDNVGMDYEDTSEADVTIQSDVLFADGFENGNTNAWSDAAP